MSYVVDTNCGNASIHFYLVACPRSPQTSSISFESSGKEAWVLKMSKWSQGNRKWYSLCGFPCDSSFYFVFYSTSEGTGGILAWEYSRHTSLTDGGKLRPKRSTMPRWFAGYKESLRCALFILFHCIVLYCILSISFHFLLFPNKLIFLLVCCCRCISSETEI